MTREEQFMQQAINIGLEGMRNNVGGPFGCVIVKDNKIIGKGCNSVIASNDPTAHAEVVAIREACKTLGSFQLEDCEVYTTCEPCPMCMGALYWARPKKIYYANSKADAAAIGFDDSFIYEEFGLPINERKMSMEYLHHAEAIKMFEEWKKMNNKTLY
ncbi:nucleoside deaminase [Panacibacter ginsenosidivorans]|uniref:Nucleoside deaminase n=1 Tax=Panacibacter ginsenosidivorans TaxID=1813871 RepID=A0A5B8VC05_9BACT|nr:nucleoside deaminase [Panacibacter ginsenosidivorans]QEC69040.1 nucleoside deaminase [Panacibacter ginsenosidivorans]